MRSTFAAARALTGLQAFSEVITGAGQAYLQKDLPALYVDLSSLRPGFRYLLPARLMEQEGIQ